MIISNFFILLCKFIKNKPLVSLLVVLNRPLKCYNYTNQKSLLGKAKLAREISDGKNEIPHKFLGRKI